MKNTVMVVITLVVLVGAIIVFMVILGTAPVTQNVTAGNIPTASATLTPPTDNSTFPTLTSPANTVTISIESSGFNPNITTIASGTTVIWVNNDTVAHKVASDPHPAHTDLPGLESGILNPGDSYSFTFIKTGSWGYHDHLNPTTQGRVIVN